MTQKQKQLNGKVANVSSKKRFDDAPTPEKEDAVREALGVEKKFTVSISIPIIGTVGIQEMVVMAIDEEDAKKKAVELLMDGEVDAEGNCAEEKTVDYDYAPSPEWFAEVNKDN